MKRREILDSLDNRYHADILCRRIKEYYKMSGFKAPEVWVVKQKSGNDFIYCIRSNIRLRLPVAV